MQRVLDQDANSLTGLVGFLCIEPECQLSKGELRRVGTAPV